MFPTHNLTSQPQKYTFFPQNPSILIHPFFLASSGQSVFFCSTSISIQPLYSFPSGYFTLAVAILTRSVISLPLHLHCIYNIPSSLSTTLALSRLLLLRQSKDTNTSTRICRCLCCGALVALTWPLKYVFWRRQGVRKGAIASYELSCGCKPQTVFLKTRTLSKLSIHFQYSLKPLHRAPASTSWFLFLQNKSIGRAVGRLYCFSRRTLIKRTPCSFAQPASITTAILC